MMKVILKDDDKSYQTGGDALNHLLCSGQPVLPHPADPALPRGRRRGYICPHTEGEVDKPLEPIPSVYRGMLYSFYSV